MSPDATPAGTATVRLVALPLPLLFAEEDRNAIYGFTVAPATFPGA
jgi:hypothetical protein